MFSVMFGKKNNTAKKKPPLLLEWGAGAGAGAGSVQSKRDAGSPAEVILVAIDATIKPISTKQHGVEWALTNVAQEGDFITLLAVIPSSINSGWKIFVRIGRECTRKGRARSSTTPGDRNHTVVDMEAQIKQHCTDMLQPFQKRCEAKKVKVKVKVVSATMKGTVAAQARKLQASWVVLDRHLKKLEEKYCMEELQCSVAMVSSNQAPKILRLNLKRSGPATAAEENPEEEQESSSVLLDGLSFSNFPLGFQSREPRAGFNTNKANFAVPTNQQQWKPMNGRHLGGMSPDNGTSSASTAPFTASDYASTSPSSASSELRGNALLSRTRNQPPNHRQQQTFSVGKQLVFSGVTSQQSSPPLTANSSPDLDLKAFSDLDRSCFASSDRQSKGVFSPGESCHEPTAISAPVSRSNSGRIRPSLINPFQLNSDYLDESAVALKASVLSLHNRGASYTARMPKGSSESLSPTMLSQLLNSPMSRSDERSKEQQDVDFNLSPDNAESKLIMSRDRRPREDRASNILQPAGGDELDDAASIRKAISRNSPPSGPPPLCSICQHHAPEFGKPAIKFNYMELEKATDGFSRENFLAQGGYGSVYKGVLPQGQKIAVKQHRMASTQGDKEFCAEVEVLGCAQHRNVVLLMGYCIESSRRLLVYEYVCNGSLDSHLFNLDNPPMEWRWRQKVAVGAARGLRFLHEDCRVGCIVHRDLRPNNILLTHDFEPLVGDFGLARCQQDGELEEETRVLGTFGYLAPEYAQTGQLTEKADVYSFGIILLELITARKAIDYSRPKGQQCLTEWARPLMEDHAAYEMIDPRLENRYTEYEAYCMLHAASLCVRRDPHARPRMSQVLKILEGDLMGGSPMPLINGSYTSAASGTKSPEELSATMMGRARHNHLGNVSSSSSMAGLPGLNVSRPLLLSSRPSSATTSPTSTTTSTNRSPRSSPRLLSLPQPAAAASLNRASNNRLQSIYHSRHNSRNFSPDELPQQQLPSTTNVNINLSRRSKP